MLSFNSNQNLKLLDFKNRINYIRLQKMKIDNKLILENSKNLNLLYVEDDKSLRDATKKIFILYFKSVDTAENGEDGFDKFVHFKNENSKYYDLVISDINMPKMNGIDMCKKIKNENSDQSIVFITAYNESSFLHEAIKIGVDGFLTKPLDSDNLKAVLYKATQIISNSNLLSSFYKQIEELNTKLYEQNNQINDEKAKLEAQIKLLKIQANATDTKHNQVEKLLAQRSSKVEKPLLEEYFSKDIDEGVENVLFINEDCEEMSELFDEIPVLLMQYSINQDFKIIDKIVQYLSKISSILLRYTPFLDPLSTSFEELSSAIKKDINHFSAVIGEDQDSVMMLFDAVNLDMDRYMNRFKIESMAMKNIHHIHHPTTLSIQQIISLLCPEESQEFDIEFF